MPSKDRRRPARFLGVNFKQWFPFKSSRSQHIDAAMPKLCDFCQWMLCNWEKSEYIQDLARPAFKDPDMKNLADLKTTALQDYCRLCYQFWIDAFPNPLSIEFMKTPLERWRTKTTFINNTAQTNQVLSLDKNFWYHKVDSSTSVDPHDPDDYEFGHPVTSSVALLPVKQISQDSNHIPYSPTFRDRKGCMNLSVQWLQNCRHGHLKCNSTGSQKSLSKFLPTRLVALDKGVNRICSSDKLPRNTEYATLSHCWGSGQFLTLKSNVLEAFYTEVPPTAISQTISDAIEAARYLGFSYLWVDTLCIIQDDPEDWRNESSLMSAVYEESGLNIAASGASDGSEGCYFERPAGYRCQVDIRNDGVPCLYDIVPHAFVDTFLGSSPLLRRGWVLQERLLAPRTLHFTKTELFWECHHVSACETFPNGIPEALIHPGSFRKRPLEHTMWPWIIRVYTRSCLTYATDKLVAISGIARQVQLQNHDQYVAGMWRANLELQLCWFPFSPESRSETRPYIAPTWSWASSNGPICQYSSFPSYKSRPTTSWVTIFDIKLQNSGHDVFGALVAGSLHLVCDVLLSVSVTLGVGTGSDGKILVAGDKEETNSEVWFDTLEYERASKVHELTALPLLSHYPGDIHTVVGLLLKSCSNQADVYERVGLFAFAVGSGFDDTVAHAASLNKTDVAIQLI
jgi:hypothetical protein